MGRTPAKLKLFLSTPSARRATYQRLQQPMRTNISIHALREEGDAKNPCCTIHHLEFLSTPSARRATEGLCLRFDDQNISIHALREEGDEFGAY